MNAAAWLLVMFSTISAGSLGSIGGFQSQASCEQFREKLLAKVDAGGLERMHAKSMLVCVEQRP